MTTTKSSLIQILNLSILCFTISTSIDFNYPTVFNFGDSNSDTGELVAGLGVRLDPPYGQTYFEIPSGRFCDGRLIVDFLRRPLAERGVLGALAFCTLRPTLSLLLGHVILVAKRLLFKAETSLRGPMKGEVLAGECKRRVPLVLLLTEMSF
ncbi:hypothetical protein SLEP1_g20504 [Rubroshorea leprosula]|uniref:GDSL esterase/lipase n=1 Tax=Rubroshorea leprosula TaxID=152421 RepID=A0AAV5J2Y1_9ROSI|nr:hypothetical protein SLEP1_g20504 [Rubroshorea leprosula]